MILKFLTLILLSGIVFASDRVGNGGGAYACMNFETAKVKAVKLEDFVLGETDYGLSYKLNKIPDRGEIIGKLKKYSPPLARFVALIIRTEERDRLKNSLRNVIPQLAETSNERIKNYVFEEENCIGDLYTIAQYRDIEQLKHLPNGDFDDNSVLVASKLLYEGLNEQEKEALKYHEMIAKGLRYFHESLVMNTTETRKLVAHLYADDDHGFFEKNQNKGWTIQKNAREFYLKGAFKSSILREEFFDLFQKRENNKCYLVPNSNLERSGEVGSTGRGEIGSTGQRYALEYGLKSPFRLYTRFKLYYTKHVYSYPMKSYTYMHAGSYETDHLFVLEIYNCQFGYRKFKPFCKHSNGELEYTIYCQK